MDRRFFLAVSGGVLTAPAWAYADQLATRGGSFAALASSGRTMTVTSAMVDTAAAATAGLRKLGGVEGGHEDTLRLVHNHLIYVARLLRQARFANAAGVSLLACMTETAVHRGRLADGIDLGRAALDAVELANAAHEAARSTPVAMRALAANRFAPQDRMELCVRCGP